MKISHSLRFLREAFLPREARFPDEDFWSKSGEPIAARKKSGPPRGTVGTTSKDWGVRDEPVRPKKRVALISLDPEDTIYGSDPASWEPFIKKCEEAGIDVEGTAGQFTLRGDEDAIKAILDDSEIDPGPDEIEWKDAKI